MSKDEEIKELKKFIDEIKLKIVEADHLEKDILSFFNMWNKDEISEAASSEERKKIEEFKVSSILEKNKVIMKLCDTLKEEVLIRREKIDIKKIRENLSIISTKFGEFKTNLDKLVAFNNMKKTKEKLEENFRAIVRAFRTLVPRETDLMHIYKKVEKI